MTAHRWLGVSLAIGIAAASFTSCKKGASTTGTGGSGGMVGSAGTGGGAGGGIDGGTSSGTGGMKGDGGPIVCLVQYTNIPKTGPCDLLAQNCPPGKTCQPAGTSTACIVSAGVKAAGETCYDGTECDAKLICIGQPVGTCVAFCCPDMAREPCDTHICNTQVNYGNGEFAYVCSYGQRCQLLTADACPPGLECHVEDTTQGIAVCGAPSGTAVPELGPCHYINDCATMQDCFVGAGGPAGVCLYYCALSGPGTSAVPGLGGCPNGETCQSTYNGQSVNTGVMNVGVCIPNGGIVQMDGGAGTDGGDGG
jgi:hypothetical protein